MPVSAHSAAPVSGRSPAERSSATNPSATYTTASAAMVSSHATSCVTNQPLKASRREARGAASLSGVVASLWTASSPSDPYPTLTLHLERSRDARPVYSPSNPTRPVRNLPRRRPRD